MFEDSKGCFDVLCFAQKKSKTSEDIYDWQGV